MSKRHTNHRRPWSQEETTDLLSRAGTTPGVKLSKRLGRSVESIRRRAWRDKINARHTALHHAGMSIEELKQALGVLQPTIESWIRKGWLRIHWGYTWNRKYRSVDPYEVSQFLTERGGLIDCLRPAPEWREEVEEARKALLVRYIRRNELASLLGFRTQYLTQMRHDRGFPEPALRFGGNTINWYDRAAVRAWLDDNPSYWTAAAREALASVESTPSNGCIVRENGRPCSAPILSRHMCRLHYKRYERHGDPLFVNGERKAS